MRSDITAPTQPSVAQPSPAAAASAVQYKALTDAQYRQIIYGGIPQIPELSFVLCDSNTTEYTNALFAGRWPKGLPLAFTTCDEGRANAIAAVLTSGNYPENMRIEVAKLSDASAVIIFNALQSPACKGSVEIEISFNTIQGQTYFTNMLHSRQCPKNSKFTLWNTNISVETEQRIIDAFENKLCPAETRIYIPGMKNCHPTSQMATLIARARAIYLKNDQAKQKQLLADEELSQLQRDLMTQKKGLTASINSITHSGSSIGFFDKRTLEIKLQKRAVVEAALKFIEAKINDAESAVQATLLTAFENALTDPQNSQWKTGIGKSETEKLVVRTQALSNTVLQLLAQNTAAVAAPVSDTTQPDVAATKARPALPTTVFTTAQPKAAQAVPIDSQKEPSISAPASTVNYAQKSVVSTVTMGQSCAAHQLDALMARPSQPVISTAHITDFFALPVKAQLPSPTASNAMDELDAVSSRLQLLAPVPKNSAVTAQCSDEISDHFKRASA